MLTRIRIEVSDEDSAAATSQALDRYETALMDAEAARFELDGTDETVTGPNGHPQFAESHDVALGREVTDEVIEYDRKAGTYRGRRSSAPNTSTTLRRRPEPHGRLASLHGQVQALR